MTFQKERYHLIDGIRGLALVNMVLFISCMMYLSSTARIRDGIRELEVISGSRNLLDLYSDFRFFLAVWQKPQHPAGYLFKYLRADHYFCNRDRCPRADRLFRYSEFSWMRGTAYGTAGKACQPPSCRGCFCGKPALLSPAASCGKRNDRNRRIDLFLSHSFPPIHRLCCPYLASCWAFRTTAYIQ